MKERRRKGEREREREKEGERERDGLPHGPPVRKESGNCVRQPFLPRG